MQLQESENSFCVRSIGNVEKWINRSAILLISLLQLMLLLMLDDDDDVGEREE